MTTGNYPPGGTWEIDNGWDVVTSDNETIGEVEEVHPHYLVVGKGLIFHSERYVPVSSITDVKNNKVHINVTKNEIETLGWDTIPDIAGTTRVPETTRTTGRRDVRDDDIDVPVVEEELDVRKRQTEEGAVRVHKDVVETEKQVTVPVREERVRVEREPVNEPVRGDMDADTFREEDIEIPLRSEEVEVSKRPVVRERVHIDKDVVEREEQASGRVRREEVFVEGEDTVNETDRP